MTDTTDLQRLLDDLRRLLDALTEGCEPGPWHAVVEGDKAAYGFWLDNAAGDSSFPEPADVALMVNALPALLAERDALLAVADAARHAGATWDADQFLPYRPWMLYVDDFDALAAALARLDALIAGEGT